MHSASLRSTYIWVLLLKVGFHKVCIAGNGDHIRREPPQYPDNPVYDLRDFVDFNFFEIPFSRIQISHVEGAPLHEAFPFGVGLPSAVVPKRHSSDLNTPPSS